MSRSAPNAWISALALCAFPLPTSAQSTADLPQGFDPPAIAPDSNGVDLISGHIRFPTPQLKIAGDNRLSIGHISDYLMYLVAKVTIGDDVFSSLAYTTGKWTSESFACDTNSGPIVNGVQVGAPCYSNASVPSFAHGLGGGMFVEARTGTTIQFAAGSTVLPTGASCSTSSGNCVIISPATTRRTLQYASTITYKDGETLQLSYDSFTVNITFQDGSSTYSYPQIVRRIKKVESNRGYEMDFTYQVDTPSSNDSIIWFTPKTVAFYRRGDYSSPLVSLSVSTLDSFGNQTITDVNGGSWYGTFNYLFSKSVPVAEGVYRSPSSPSVRLSASSTAKEERISGGITLPSLLVTSVTKGSDVWNYSYSHAIPRDQPDSTSVGLPYGIRTVTVTGPNGYRRVVKVDEQFGDGGRIIEDTDSLGRTTKYVWGQDPAVLTSARVLSEVDFPEGNKEIFHYDRMGNVISHQTVPKPGSTLVPILLQASYPGGPCDPAAYIDASGKIGPPPITCYRPVWTKDAKGNQTDYTWDPTTGMILTRTSPARPDGVRPQVRYSYTQRYAWWSDGAGGYVKAATPIWVKTRESYCQNSGASGNIAAPCLGNDEVVTDYDYGPDAGPNMLLVRGVATTSGGQTLRTCYGYDLQGNKISETKPAAGLAVCL